LKQTLSLALLWGASLLSAQTTQHLSPAVQAFVEVDNPLVALVHVRVIDGTEAPASDNQTILIAAGIIRAVGPAASVPIPPQAHVIDLKGQTALPGLIGMHDHLFYPVQSWDFQGAGIPVLYAEMGFTFPRLFLAAGVTSIRTAGSIEPYTDLELKRLVDEGKIPGPKLHITGPFLEAVGAYIPQMHQLSGPDDARRTVQYWASEGVTSFKAYMHITRAELKETIAAAHARRLKVTGHLCSIGFREAASLGIDNLEHGLLEDSEFVADKKPDVCPAFPLRAAAISKLDLNGAPVHAMIQDLVRHHVAVTSTLALYESYAPDRPPLSQIERSLKLLAPGPFEDYQSFRRNIQQSPDTGTARLRMEMKFEREFVKAGGMLLAGLDPNGGGGLLAGFGDQRELELLVEAGFTPLQAIHIATSNGARFLGESTHIGTIAAGKSADIVIVDGNPAEHIQEIEKVKLVFKDGIGYNPAKLIHSVQGAVGLH
jgi:imidazolonepropionase-like amidohydrolase